MSPFVSGYRHGVEPVVRGRVGVAATVGIFLVGAAIGGRVGLAVAAAWVLVTGTYCLANFWCCHETHCVVTGAGWTALGLGVLAAASMPDGGPGWLRVDVVALAFLAVLGAGYGFEGAVATRTGRHYLGPRGGRAKTR